MKVSYKKTGIAALLTIIMIIMSFTALNLFSTAQAPIPVDLIPAGIQLIPGSFFYIDVFVLETYAEPLDGFDFMVSYDSNTMTATGLTEGPMIPGGDRPIDVDLSILGQVHFWSLPNGLALNPASVLAIIEFRCDAIGSTPIDLDSDSVFFDSMFNPYAVLPSPGHVNVNQEYPVADTIISPPTKIVPISTPFTVNVDVVGVTDLWVYHLQLSYDTLYVDAIDVVPGNFLPTPVVDFKVVDDAAGMIWLQVHNNDSAGISGDGTLATITFHCTAAGESILHIEDAVYTDPLGFIIQTTVTDGRVIQFAWWEPAKLQHLVEWPYPYASVDIPFVPPGSPEGYAEIKFELEAKGFAFDEGYGGSGTWVESFFDVTFDVGGEYGEFQEGTVTSWWSANILEDGSRACLLSYESSSDGSSMAMGFVTNLLPPEQIPDVDPYIIYNAEPYFFIDFYWFSWAPIGRVVHCYYWWHDSHNHPNWYWGPYWWWRTYTKTYYLGMPWDPTNPNWAVWRPWWGWWWHWVYWRHWYWWSSYFPYDP